MYVSINLDRGLDALSQKHHLEKQQSSKEKKEKSKQKEEDMLNELTMIS